MPQSLLKLFKLANLKSTYLASLVPSCRNPSKDSAMPSPGSLCLLTASGDFLWGMKGALLEGILSNKVSFQW